MSTYKRFIIHNSYPEIVSNLKKVINNVVEWSGYVGESSNTHLRDTDKLFTFSVPLSIYYARGLIRVLKALDLRYVYS